MLRSISHATLSQVISSGTNFAFSLYLLRALPIQEFGYYNISIAVVIFISGFGQALFLEQMTVIMPNNEDANHSSFSTSVLILILAVIVLILIIILGVFATLYLSGFRLVDIHFYTLTALCGCIFMVKEFFLRLAFNMRRGIDAIVINLSFAISLLCLAVLAKILVLELNTQHAIAMYSFANLMCVAVAWRISQVKFSSISLRYLSEVFSEILKDGRWGAATSLVYALRNQAHIIVVGITVGPTGVAILSAAKMLVTPSVMLIPAMSQIALPRLALISSRLDINKLRKETAMIAFALLAFALLYSAVVIIFYEHIAGSLLSAEYGDLYNLVALWCLYAVSMALRSALNWALMARRRFKVMTIIQTAAAFITLLSVYVLSISLGLSGAIAGLILSEITILIFTYFATFSDRVKTNL